jgi:hypothetical protein
MSPSELLGLPKMLVFVTGEHTYKITDAYQGTTHREN